MSVKVDVEKSTKARTDGNASFRKGRWTEAIGHYTTAIVFNPEDGLGYANRAAAYLKIDKYKDAERDCSTAISLAKGDGNIKALYRRALARKSLDHLEGAIEDIKAVLKVEPSNETAKEELEELGQLVRKAGTQEGERRKQSKARALPPSPPRPPAGASLVEIPDLPELKDSSPIEEVSEETKAVPVQSTAPASSTFKGSFADMKKGRQAGRKAYAAPSEPRLPSQAAVTPAEIPKPTSPLSLPLEAVTIGEPSPSATFSTPSQPALPLLDPTMPGSAMSLVSSIRSYPATATYPLMADLAKRPASIGKMLDNFLEPDQLALILVRLQEMLQLDRGEGEERKEVVRGFMSGLRTTRRWSMTAIMLSVKEKQLGQEVWSAAGGAGDWTKGA